MKWFLLIMMVLTTAGCESRYLKLSNKGIDKMHGKNISALVKVIGYPASDAQVMGKHIYTWGSDDDCKLQVIVDSQDVITEHHWGGYTRRCQLAYKVWEI